MLPGVGLQLDGLVKEIRFLRVQAGFRVAEKFLAFLLHDDW